MYQKIKNLFSKDRLLLYSLIVLVLSYGTYFWNYNYPPAPFWDENYYIADAQKYLEGVAFMQMHPPLGKFFIAAGEYIFQPNKNIDHEKLSRFTATEHINNFPTGYSFLGTRSFPVIFGWLSAILFFYILYLICNNLHVSLLFSSFYIFENALIVHFRGAMLDSTLIFFTLLTILYFTYLIQKKNSISWKNYFVLGIFAGLAFMTKYIGGIVFLTFPFLWWHNSRPSLKPAEIEQTIINFLSKALYFGLGAGIIFVLVWQTHFMLGKKIEPNGMPYNFSGEYRTIISRNSQWNIFNFPVMLRDNINYAKEYNKGIPKLDICKLNENGSLVLTWPVGNKAINYRWESGGKETKYLYLQGNPAVWFISLIAVFFSIALILAKFIFGLPLKNKKIFYFIEFFTLSYIFYMIAMLKIESGRVLFSNSYFIPLLFSMVLACLIFSYVFEDTIKTKPKTIYRLAGAFVILIILAYLFFSPLTYYKPLTREQFYERAWLPFWHLTPI